MRVCALILCCVLSGAATGFSVAAYVVASQVPPPAPASTPVPSLRDFVAPTEELVVPDMDAPALRG